MRLCVRDECGRGNSLKLLLLGPQRVERDERHAIVGACHRTSNGQEHKIIRRAEPERDTIFHRVVAVTLFWHLWKFLSCSCVHCFFLSFV